MKIKYKILWLDDKIKDFIEDDYVKEVENYLVEQGFISDIKTVSNSKEFFNELNNEFDLILTDYHMKGMNGDKVVEEVRKKDVQTEILFYTAQADLTDAAKIDRVSFLETSGLGEHEEKVVSKLIALIDLTIKKFQHIVVMRGMIMHETSHLDEEKYNILINYLKADENFETATYLENATVGRLEASLKSNNKTIKKLKDGSIDFFDLMNIPGLFSAYFQTKALGDLIEQVGGNNFIESYQNDIIKVRNQFAHSVLKEEDGKEYFDHKDGEIIFDDEACKSIRKNIQKHQQHLQDLKQNLMN